MTTNMIAPYLDVEAVLQRLGVLLSRQAKKIPASRNSPDDDDVSDEDEAAEMADDSVKEDAKKKKHSKHKLARELSDLVVICQSVSFKGFDYAKDNCEWEWFYCYLRIWCSTLIVIKKKSIGLTITEIIFIKDQA